MRWTGSAICVIGLALLAGAPVSAQEAVDVAILPLSQDARDASVLIEQQLLAEPSVRLVDRAQVQRVMAERAMALALDTEPSVWRDLSQVLPAEVYVLITASSAEPDATLPMARGEALRLTTLAAVETRTGIVLGSVTAEGELDAGVIDELSKGLLDMFSKTRVPEDQRVFLAFLGVAAEVESSEIERIADMLTVLVGRRLVVEPNVTMLERHQVALLAQERVLSGLPPEWKTSSMIVRGGLRVDGSTGLYTLAMSVTHGDGSVTESQDALAMASFSEAAEEVTRRVLAATSIGAGAAKPMDSMAEADQLRRRSLALQSYAKLPYDARDAAMLKDAVAFAEAAVALDPTEPNRRCLIDAYLGRARSFEIPEQWLDRVEMYTRLVDVDLLRVKAYLDTVEPGTELPWEVLAPYYINYTRGNRRPPDDVVRAQERYESLNYERVSLYARLIETQSPERQLHLLRYVPGHLEELVTNPSQYREWAVYFLNTADKAWTALRTADPDHVERNAELRLMPVPNPAEVRWQRDAIYVGYLAYLDRHQNPLIRLYALGARVELKGDDSVLAATRIIEQTMDPRSAVNQLFDEHEPDRTGRDAHSHLLRDAIKRFVEVNGWEALAKQYDRYLRRVEQTSSGHLLVRWQNGTAAVLDVARDEKNPQLVALAERIGKVLEAYEPDPEAEVLAISRTRLQRRVDHIVKGTTLQTGSPWNEYTLEPFHLDRMASGECQMIGAAVVTVYDGEPVEQPYYLALLADNTGKDPDRRLTTRNFHLYRVEADCSEASLLGSGAAPIPDDDLSRTMGRMHSCFDAVAIDDVLYFTFIDRPGLYTLGTELRVFGEETGVAVPPKSRLLAINDRLFVAWEGMLAEFDRAAGRFNVLASARATATHSALDNTTAYAVGNMLAEPEANAFLFPVKLLSDEGGGGDAVSGIWRFDLHENRLEHYVAHRMMQEPEGLAWVDGELRLVLKRMPLIYRIDSAARTVTMQMPQIDRQGNAFGDGIPDMMLRSAIGLASPTAWRWSRAEFNGCTFASPTLQLRQPDGTVFLHARSLLVNTHSLLATAEGVTAVQADAFLLIRKRSDEPGTSSELPMAP